MFQLADLRTNRTLINVYINKKEIRNYILLTRLLTNIPLLYKII